jgi:RNA polymerase sigma-70 factor (ECF subfamily)
MAGAQTDGNGKAALAELCRDYWKPLYHFARRSGFSPQDAEDVTQGFIAGLIESQSIGRENPARGRFRTFLLGAIGYFLANHRRGQSTQKRGGWQALDTADASLELASPDWMTPERYYEQSWAQSLVGKVMTRLRQDFEKAGCGALFTLLHLHLSGAAGRPGYAQLGESLGLAKTPSQ